MVKLANMLAAFLEAWPPDERLHGRKSQVDMCNYDYTTWIQSTISFSVKQLDLFSFCWCCDQYMLILSWQNNWWWGTQSHNLLFYPLVIGLLVDQGTIHIDFQGTCKELFSMAETAETDQLIQKPISFHFCLFSSDLFGQYMLYIYMYRII